MGPRSADAREVSLIARGTAGYQALIARPVLEGLARTVIELSAVSKRTGKPDPPMMTRWPAAIDLPGLEQFGGPKAAAALSAPAPLWLHGNLGALDASWPRAAYQLAGTPPNCGWDRMNLDRRRSHAGSIRVNEPADFES